jgi:NADH-quinone oxidoreductase subunit H
MEEYAAMFLMSVVAAIFFLGGFESPFTHIAREQFGDTSIIYQATAGFVLLVKAMFGIFLMMWLRWTLPRVRIDQVMTMGYKYLTPLALGCVALGATWETARHAGIIPW